ncbi:MULTISPECIES: trypsin-like serine protease [unclassified Duganella]|uniref:trypsin-like serine protease n=1 Tax=unclassified Duganella TaxID=2636909 RepID=UPI000E3524EC|nr:MULTISPECIES: trypsin-like serine protease [unclassified Duganella]RFP14939.1 PEP-CTERM sorting domain-containing protein [Duganella sp. BJB475]RFP31289.1 PEP-CTERM sorting domain-containing protein [Duganella sp. BJB476]
MIFNTKQFKLAAVAAALLAAGAAQASSGLSADLAKLVPMTGNTSSLSDWRFTAGQSFNGVAGALDGVARLTFTNSEGGWGCSGSLLAGGQYVLTAAHCADDFTKMTVEFGYQGGKAAVTRNVSVGNAFVNPAWHGEKQSLDAGSDMAILKLDTAVTGIKGYKLSTTNDVGKDYLMAGYGTTQKADVNSPTSWNVDGAYGHFGYNTFDIDSKTFNKVAGDNGIGVYDESFYAPGTTYMSDFDDGTAAHNTLARIAGVTGNKWSSSLGHGANEALIAGGDSGGGDFVWNGTEWLLSGVHSWGWQGSEACPAFGLTGCDNAIDNTSSYGDLSGSTATFSHVAWISSVTAVPEPETYAMMIAGLALVGVARRRKQA